MTTTSAAAMEVPAMRPRRTIEGISAVLLPFDLDDRPDWAGFRHLLARTWQAGLTPAVNMDTGYVNLLTSVEREQVLRETVRRGGRPSLRGGRVHRGGARGTGRVVCGCDRGDSTARRHSDPVPVECARDA